MPSFDSTQITVVGLLLAIGAAGLRGLWVWGWVYKSREKDLLAQLEERTADRDFWRGTALKAMGHTDKALNVAEGKRTARGGVG